MKPLLKYPGGKTKLLQSLTSNLPENIANVVEPFCGSGVFGFKLLESIPNISLHFNDLNDTIIDAYILIALANTESYNKLISLIDSHFENNSEEYYYECRDKYNKTNSILSKISLLFYLNRSCFNGLYRVNSNGEFNVPYGHYKNLKKNLIIDLIHQARTTLYGREKDSYNSLDYRLFLNKVVQELEPDNTLIYFDSPYLDSYDSYTKEKFNTTDHNNLAFLVQCLSDQGYKIMLSNSNNYKVKELYKNFNIEEVVTQRTIARSVRPVVTELLIRNF